MIHCMTRLLQAYKQLAIIFYIVGYWDKWILFRVHTVNTWLNSVEFTVFCFNLAFFHPRKDLFLLSSFCGNGGLLSVLFKSELLIIKI